MAHFKNIISNLFGNREDGLKKDSVELICKATDLSIDRVSVLTNSKNELIKAFDAFNDSHVIDLEKAQQSKEPFVEDAIKKRLNRYEESFLSDIDEVETQLVKAEEQLTKDLEIALTAVPSDDMRYDGYAKRLGKGSDVVVKSNHFAGLSFDTNVENLSFTEVCEMLSKAIDEGALEKSELPFVLQENEFHHSLLTLAKAKEENLISEDLIEKGSRRLSDLTPVRRQVVSANGTVYMKTVYVKKEEKAAEKAATFLNQKEYEDDGIQPGDKVAISFQGWSSGRPYSVDKAEVVSVGRNSVKVKFIEDFNTGSYTYGPGASEEKGRTVEIPLTKNEKWSQVSRLERWVDPESERRRQRELEKRDAKRGERDLARLMKTHNTDGSTDTQSAGVVVVNNSDNINTGDQVSFEKSGETIRGRVRSMWRQGEGKARLEVVDSEGKVIFKTIGPSTRRGEVNKIITGDTVDNTSSGITVKNPTTFTNNTVRKLGLAGIKFGGNNLTETKTVFEGENGKRLWDSGSLKDWGENFNKNFPNFDAVELLSDVKKEMELAGVGSPSLTFRAGSSNGSFDIEIRGSGGFQMTRNFSVTSDTPPKSKVYNAYFTVGDSRRSAGIGKKLFRLYNKQYRRCGLDGMSVSAGLSCGGYTWARFGFMGQKSTAENFARQFQDKVGRRTRIQKPDGTTGYYTMSQRAADQAKKVVKDFYDNNPNTARFPMNALASIDGTKAGRSVMLGSSWGGTLDLKDLQQRDNFETYIKYD